MEFNNDDEVIELINRLLEKLHQADEGKGSNKKIEIVIVQPGAQHVDTIQTQNVYTHQSEKEKPGQQTLPCPPCVGREKETGQPALPETLSSEAAMVLWRKVQEAGLVDAYFQPKISRTQAALLADAMAERLGIRKKWKVFEALWQRKNMRSDYNEAMNLRKTLEFQDLLRSLLSE